MRELNEPKFVCNWITAEVFKKLNALEVDDRKITLNPALLAKMLKLYKDGEINQAGARKIFDIMWNDLTANPEKLVNELGLKQMNDTNELRAVLERIVNDNPKAVSELKAGNEKTMAFFVGQAMKATQGKANPKLVADIVRELIK